MTNVVLTGSSFDNGELSEIGNKLLEYSSSISVLSQELNIKIMELENEIDELNENIEYYEKEIKTYQRFYNDAKSNYDAIVKEQKTNNGATNNNSVNIQNNRLQKPVINKRSMIVAKLD